MRGLPVLAFVTCAVVVACASSDDNGDSEDNYTSEGTPDTSLSDRFLKSNKTAFERGRPGVIRYIVIHDIEGSASSAINTFRNPTAVTSAHYIIDKAGKITQMVRETDTANHAGHSAFNGYGIGIEHEGFMARDGYTEEEYRGSARLVADVAKRHGIPLDDTHVIGHSQIPRTDPTLVPCARTATTCGGKNQHGDPGKFWNWAHYMTLVKDAARAIDYDGIGKPDPEITAAPLVSFKLNRALPQFYWITQCTAADETKQLTLRTIDKLPKLETRYLQRTATPCGDRTLGVAPLLFHGFSKAELANLTVEACTNGRRQTFAVSGETNCDASGACAVLSATRDEASSSCP